MDREVTVLADCLAAIRGERVPIPQHLEMVVARASLIRGIRLHYTFATSEAVTGLCERDPQLARARNARLIMSNQIPDRIAQDEQPYCIWHPDLATEDTYRKLAKQYPLMRYLVGRACAAAGYYSLYLELGLLPEVSIAEEAREGETEGGRLIYENIMSAPMRYSILHDCDRSVMEERPRFPAFLNGDTEVRLQLQVRGWTPEQFSTRCRTIEEDWSIDDEFTTHPRWRESLDESEIQLLYNPLPLDLPTLRTTLLMHMAAHEGNIERYSRLKCPMDPMNDIEKTCVIRGIYHHTMFARWWAEEIARSTPRAELLKTITPPKQINYLQAIKRAIMARRIMINACEDIEEHGWHADTPFPYLIWWPLRPSTLTLLLLAEKVPQMKEQAAVAAIYCDYQTIYRMIQARPNACIWEAACQSPNPFYRADVEKRAAELHIVLESDIRISEYDPDWACVARDLEPTCIDVATPERGQALEDSLYTIHGPYGEAKAPGSWDTEYAVWLR